jgi:integrase/recombinase XerD
LKKSVDHLRIRKHTNYNKTLFEEHKMAQARTLKQAEIDQVLRYIATKQRYTARNRAMLLTSFYSGMRVGEIATVRIGDIRNDDGSIKSEVRLSAAQTKGNSGRVVFINEKLRAELASYLRTHKHRHATEPLFFTEKQIGFSPNSLAQWFFWVYKNAGVSGASSHSGRRSFATTISARGVGIKVLQKLLGHKNIQTTSVYIDASDQMLRNAVELV